jgi:hypothetical protein
MKKALLVLFFGFLPLWLLLLVLAAARFTTLFPNLHENSATWLLVAAVLCSVVTLTLALSTLRKPPASDPSSQAPDD